MIFLCSTCNKYHNDIPMSYGSPTPYYWYQLSAEEKSNSDINSDLCIIDNKQFFIRGCINIPVQEESDIFVWDVWVSLSEENFELQQNYWYEDDREHLLQPMFGWLSTQIPCYPSTLNLKTMVYTRSRGLRPIIKIEPTEHPLSVEQQSGISFSRVKEFAEILCADAPDKSTK